MNRRRSKECERILRLLPDFAVGMGSSRRRTKIQRHLGDCSVCAQELRALERTSELLDCTPLEPAPDIWGVIRPKLRPRKIPAGFGRLAWWVGRHRLQSVAATAAAAIALAAWLLTAPQSPPKADAQAFLANHASMSWREPFADKAGLGLAGAVPIQVESEDMQ